MIQIMTGKFLGQNIYQPISNKSVMDFQLSFVVFIKLEALDCLPWPGIKNDLVDRVGALKDGDFMEHISGFDEFLE